MSGQSLGQIAGAAIGFWLGGPLGASIGASIGGYVGSTFDPTQKFEGPRLTDLRIQTSSYGSLLPLVYGEKNRVAGTVIWSTGLIEKRKKKKSGGKGGGGGSSVTTYSYSTSAAVSLSEGPCKNIRKIWANSKVLFDIEKVLAEVTKLEAKATKLDGYADDAEAALAASPDDPMLQQEAAYWRSRATAAAAAATAAASNYGAAVTGNAPWVLQKGSGLPNGPLAYLAFYPGNTTQNPDSKIEAKLGAGNAPAYRGTCYVVLGTLQLANYGNSLPNLEFELDGLAPRTAGDIVADICTRSGMATDEFTVRSQLSQIAIEGYTIGRAQNSIAAIAPLQKAYAFDTVEQNGEVRFVPRGGGPVAVIPLSDTVARTRDDLSKAVERGAVDRFPDFDLVKEVSVTYRDPERDYQDNTQRAVRLFGDSYTVISEEIPIVMSASQARKISDRLLWEVWSNRSACRIEVSDKYRFLFAGDVVALQVAGSYWPFRIANRARGSNGQIELELSVEDPFVYNGSTVGEAATTPINDASDPGDTFVAALNTPILSVDQTSTGFMWVMNGASAGWAGGAIYRSLDNGLTYTEMATSNERNVTGTVATALPSGPVDIWDRVNTLTVTLLNPDDELESLTEVEVLNGKNAIWLGAADGSHGEIIQFATATLVSTSPRIYTLSDLLRGRRGTEHEVTLHGANELLVFLEADLMHTADYDVSDWDRERVYKGVSVYEEEDEVVDFQTFVNLGERAKPRSPVHGRGSRDGSNNLTITWIRRIRGFQYGIGYGSLPLDEATESYEVDVIVGGIVKRTLTASSPSVSYTAAQQTTDGITPGNPVTVKVYQLSASRGRGHAGVFTI